MFPYMETVGQHQVFVPDNVARRNILPVMRIDHKLKNGLLVRRDGFSIREYQINGFFVRMSLKIGCQTIIDGQKYAMRINDEKWEACRYPIMCSFHGLVGIYFYDLNGRYFDNGKESMFDLIEKSRNSVEENNSHGTREENI